MSAPCISLNCFVPNDLTVCPSFAAIARLSFLVQCPTGYVCPAGLFPVVVTYEIADIPQVQVCSFGGPFTMTLQDCNGNFITRNLPEGSTQAQIQAAVTEVQTAWGQAQAICDVIRDFGNVINPKGVGNDRLEFICPDGRPPNFLRQVGNSSLTIFAGQGVRLIVQNDSDMTIIGSDFQLFFGAVLIHTGTLDIPPHTIMQEFDVFAGSPLPSWCIFYQGHVITFPNGCGPNLAFKYVLQVQMLNPFNGGGGVTVDSGGNVVIPAGTVSRPTKAEANAVAQQMLDDVVAAAMSAGTLTCP